MEEQKEPLSLNKKSYTHSCPKCNLPVRVNDKKCMYCNAPLKQNRWGFFLFLRQYFQWLQWRLRLNKRKSREFKYLKFSAFFGVGITLTLIGGYLFAVSIFSNDFSNWIISLLFLFYGIYTLKTLFLKNKSSGK